MQRSDLIEVFSQECMFDLVNRQTVGTVPCYAYVKDSKGKYVFGNDQILMDAGLSDLSGTTDFDFCKPSVAQVLALNDDETKFTNEAKIFFEPVEFTNSKKVMSLSYKAPLISQEKKVIGVVGLSFKFEHDVSIKFSSTLEKPNKVFPTLSPQQKECLKLFIKGRTIKDIGKELNLSYRTVGHYLDAIKVKLNCQNRVDLIIKSINYFNNS